MIKLNALCMSHRLDWLTYSVKVETFEEAVGLDASSGDHGLSEVVDQEMQDLVGQVQDLAHGLPGSDLR